jgi:DnaJ-class molecular chaperone
LRAAASPQKWHPDKHVGDESAKAQFQRISEAYHGARPARRPG